MAALKLTKQMQYVILGVLLTCGALFAIINFILVPIITEWKASLHKTQEIQAKLEDVRAVIKTRQDIQQQLDAAQDKIRQCSAHIPLPALGNYLLGMKENVYAGVKELDVQISQVVNQDILELESGAFKVYRVRVTAQAGFRPLIRLFQNLETSNPLCSISGLTIVPREDNHEKHDVTFSVAWLIWSNPTRRPVFVQKTETKEQKPEPGN